MAKISGLGHLSEKSRKYEWFRQPVLGKERLFNHNLQPYLTQCKQVKIPVQFKTRSNVTSYGQTSNQKVSPCQMGASFACQQEFR